MTERIIELATVFPTEKADLVLYQSKTKKVDKT